MLPIAVMKSSYSKFSLMSIIFLAIFSEIELFTTTEANYFLMLSMLIWVSGSLIEVAFFDVDWRYYVGFDVLFFGRTGVNIV